MINRRIHSQRGAALLIVLLLVATMAFIMLSVVDVTSRSAARSFNSRVRSEMFWQALGAEQLARAAIAQALEAREGIITADDPWLSEPVILPLENGRGALYFADASGCFNLNSLSADADDRGGEETETPAVVFARLARNIGASEFAARALADVVGDWVDADTARRPQGAEDEYYTALPSAYRTGNSNLVSATELRAMKGADRDLYRAMKPFLCALPVKETATLNINTLTLRHAPFMAAMLGDNVSISTAEDLIRARPPGGYRDLNAFLSLPAIEELELSASQRGQFALKSAYLQARAEILYESADIILTMDFAVGEGSDVKLLSRRIGTDE